MDASFVLISQDLSQRTVPLNRPRTVIGRQTDCNIRIPSSGVSRQHCEILIDGDAITVRDLNSSNGTYLNRKRITEARLNAGDLLAIGNCVFVTRINGEPGVIDSEDVLEDGAVSAPDGAVPGRASEAQTTITSRPAKPAEPTGKGRLVGSEDNDDSDSFDFDFSDDDEKRPPKL
ncbi:MAG: FHA domain-containing protein [Phycisphaerales bacterium]|nr:FHA domain-containing protein [Phycisphaerales bacterium]